MFGGDFYTLIIGVSLVLSVLVARRILVTRVRSTIEKAGLSNASWSINNIESFIHRSYHLLNAAKSKADTSEIRANLTERMLDKFSLELEILEKENRAVFRDRLEINSISLVKANVEEGWIIADIATLAWDKLIDRQTGEEIFSGLSQLNEYWQIINKDGRWLLDYNWPAWLGYNNLPNSHNRKNLNQIFAEKNSYYYDPNFGNQMLPNKGALFEKVSFRNDSVRDHVIGRHNGIPILFYNYTYPINQRIFTVAQAILPKTYGHILLKPRDVINWPIGNLNKIETESGDFNKIFNLYASDSDQISSFELLAPDFMQQIIDMKAQVAVEVIDSYLYVYSSDNKITYEILRIILERAFRELKM